MSSTNGKDKQANDSYQTPLSHCQALMNYLVVDSDDRFLEPCRGVGNIYNSVHLPEAQKYWAELDEGKDYLTTEFREMDLIITNPPFTLTEEFLRKSFRELSPTGTLCYLQRVNYLGSIKRLDFWQEIGHPEKAAVLVPRPTFVKGGSDSCEYMWMIWDRGDRFPNIPKGLSSIVDPTSPKVIKYFEELKRGKNNTP